MYEIRSYDDFIKLVGEEEMEEWDVCRDGSLQNEPANELKTVVVKRKQKRSRRKNKNCRLKNSNTNNEQKEPTKQIHRKYKQG